jgi:hypothetical protein
MAESEDRDVDARLARIAELATRGIADIEKAIKESDERTEPAIKRLKRAGFLRDYEFHRTVF